MMRILCALLFSAAAVNAFAPRPEVNQVTLSRQMASGYVPDGLTPAEWAKKRKEEDAKKKGNKNRFPKGKAFVTMAGWLEELERKQNLLGGKIVGSGHTFAKNKFDSKEDFDAAKKRK